MANISKFQIFNNCIDSLKETSKDQKNSQYMNNSSMDVVNFDKVKNTYSISGLNTSDFRSNDALIILNNDTNYIFVEFKNGTIDSGPKYELELEKIRNKINESLWIFNSITNFNISNDKASVKYILVYNASKNRKFAIKKSQSIKAGKKFFADNKLEHFLAFFKDVQTVTQIEFDQIINSIHSGTYIF